jgi:hypothetical protein
VYANWYALQTCCCMCSCLGRLHQLCQAWSRLRQNHHLVSFPTHIACVVILRLVSQFMQFKSRQKLAFINYVNFLLLADFLQFFNY